MAVINYLTTAPIHDITRIARGGAGIDARAYTGSIRKHPYDPKRFLLIEAASDESNHFYEFRLEDVVTAEDVRQIVSEDGEAVQVVRIGIRRGSRAIEMHPFTV